MHHCLLKWSCFLKVAFIFWKVYLKLVTNRSLTAVVPQIPYAFVTRLLRRSDPLVSQRKLTGGEVYHSQRFIHIPGWIWSCLSNPKMRKMVGQRELGKQLKALQYSARLLACAALPGESPPGRGCLPCPLQVLLINFSHLGHPSRRAEFGFAPSLWNLIFSTCVLQEYLPYLVSWSTLSRGLGWGTRLWISHSCGFNKDCKCCFSAVLVFNSNYTSFTVSYLCHQDWLASTRARNQWDGSF